MNFEKLPVWLQSLVGSLGGLGLFVVAFLDSSVLSFPVINDLLVMHLSMRSPTRMPFYAGMALLGSLAGSAWLYWMARKGGQWAFRKQLDQSLPAAAMKPTAGRAARVRAWVERNGFLSVALPSMLPPPMPFKAFVLAAGGLGVPVKTFVLALVVGRGLRYFGEGLLAVRYGDRAVRYLLDHKIEFALIVTGVIVGSYLLTRLVFRFRPPAGPS